VGEVMGKALTPLPRHPKGARPAELGDGERDWRRIWLPSPRSEGRRAEISTSMQDPT